MSSTSALISLGEVIVEAGKGGQAFGPLVTLSPLLVGGGAIGDTLDALPADSSTTAKVTALQTLVGIVGSLLVDPKYAPQTKAALKAIL